MKILSVDDKAENLYMIEALLRGHGHQVDSASNGVEALQRAESGGYDMIVSDVLMPRMDGFQLCREVKKSERLHKVPFVFYTATYTDPKDIEFGLSLGADRFLTKPLEPEKFIEAIEEVIAEHRRGEGSAATHSAPEDEAIYLKEYNARLVAKVEKKVLDLEAANRALQEDISERERAQAERAKLELALRQAQKMEAVGTLAGGIAHDFNNILAGVIGFAELGLQDAADPGASVRHFEEILRASNRARDLVRQILAFSRHREQPRQALSLESTVQEALRLLRATIPSTVVIESQFEPQLPSILADSTQLHQLVTNLVTNAWHAIGEAPGRIEVLAGTFNVDADFSRTHPDLRPGRYVRLSISDTGHGMDGPTIERIFEPFFTTKDSSMGTGLGLSVVHGIVKNCDGAITVYSEPNEGTTFHLYFPALEFDAAPTAAGGTAAPKGNGERVLFVDDEPVLATLGERFLQRLGYDPLVVTDPGQAIHAFRLQPFDLVITDLTMPLVSGVDLARQIWEIKPSTPIVLTTGYSATLDPSRATRIGFSELLLKPYNIQALGECLQRVLAAENV
jgi:CheY-like chemotaxis protein